MTLETDNMIPRRIFATVSIAHCIQTLTSAVPTGSLRHCRFSATASHALTAPGQKQKSNF